MIRSLLSDWGFSLKGFQTNKNGEWWLIIQLLLIGAHFLPPILINVAIAGNIALVIKIMAFLSLLFGIYFGTYSLIVLGNNLSPLPEPKVKAILVTRKVYNFCRHPLYLSLILISISINLFLKSVLHLTLLVSLCIVLIGKAHSEEKRLKRKYSNYSLYMQSTPAIIKGLHFFDWNK